ncbi:glycosyltransferase family 4 protein [Alkalinema pantanalense CENA528]|uniref:glycosyltransferase family 4 protein n=1 Tax=Alkalinema pantanalense TaxID=1620705 RepID=UPI003D6FA70D
MKIAIVNQPWGDLNPENPSGSIPILIHETAQRLASLGHEIYIFNRGKWLQTTKRHKNIVYRYLPILLDKVVLKILSKLPIWSSTNPLFASKLTYFSYGLQLAMALRTMGCDIVHIHNFSQLIPIVRWLNPKIKIVLHMHCEWLTKLDQTLLAPRLHQTNLIIGCSEFITNGIRQRFPEIADRCHTVLNGVNTSYFRPANNRSSAPPSTQPLKILYIGRLSPEKGIHVLLDAFEQVHRQFPDVQLDVIGPQEVLPMGFLIDMDDDPQVLALERFYPESEWQQYLHQWQRSRPAGQQVRFVGNVKFYDLPQHYQTADLFVFPSVCNEAFGLPVAEAMAAGLPVIVSDKGALPELVQNHAQGQVVPAHDANALAAGIVELLEKSQQRQTLAIENRQRAVVDFDWQPLIQRLEFLYQTTPPI